MPDNFGIRVEEPSLIKGGVVSDERGIVRFVNQFHFERVKRFYVLENWRPFFVRAWHGHAREEKWVTVMRGSAKVCVVRLEAFLPSESPATWKVHQFVLDEYSPAILHIPPGYANGSMAMVEGTQVLHFSSLTIEEAVDDDLRWPWDALPCVWDVQQR